MKQKKFFDKDTFLGLGEIYLKNCSLVVIIGGICFIIDLDKEKHFDLGIAKKRCGNKR